MCDCLLLTHTCMYIVGLRNLLCPSVSLPISQSVSQLTNSLNTMHPNNLIRLLIHTQGHSKLFRSGGAQVEHVSTRSMYRVVWSHAPPGIIIYYLHAQRMFLKPLLGQKCCILCISWATGNYWYYTSTLK